MFHHTMLLTLPQRVCCASFSFSQNPALSPTASPFLCRQRTVSSRQNSDIESGKYYLFTRHTVIHTKTHERRWVMLSLQMKSVKCFHYAYQKAFDCYALLSILFICVSVNISTTWTFIYSKKT